MKHLLSLTSNTHLLAMSILLSVLIIAPLASKLIFWPAILSALVILSGNGRKEVAKLIIRSRVTLVLTALVVWGALSYVWSIDPSHSLLSVLRVFLIACIALLLVTSAFLLGERNQDYLRDRMRRTGWLGLALTLLAVTSVYGYTHWHGEQEFLQERLNYFNRTTAVLLAFSWSIFATIQISSKFSEKFSYLILMGILCLLTPSSALLVAFLCGLGVFGLSYISLPLSKAVLLISFVLYIFLIPFIGIVGAEITNILSKVISIPTAELHRIEVWNFSVGRIFEHPILGFGFDTSQKIPGGYEMVLLHTMPNGTTITGALMPLHPHSAPIQLWLELGLPGLLICLLFFYFVVSSISLHTSSTHESRAAMATIASCFVMAILSFDLWQGWWLFTLCSAAALNIAITRQVKAK